MSKVYNIFLDNEKIGTTDLESADPAMGVAFGVINFINDSFNYKFFSDYCKRNKIEVDEEDTTHKAIFVSSINKLSVKSDTGVEITGEGGYRIEGMDSDNFYINILGIPYPFYEEEFPHHVRTYKEKYS